MFEAAEQLQFEAAAGLRDQIASLKAMPEYGSTRNVTRADVDAPKPKAGTARSRTGITGKSRRRSPAG